MKEGRKKNVRRLSSKHLSSFEERLAKANSRIKQERKILTDIKTLRCTFATAINYPWWAELDSNPRPRDYESPALTTELQAQTIDDRNVL